MRELKRGNPCDLKTPGIHRKNLFRLISPDGRTIGRFWSEEDRAAFKALRGWEEPVEKCHLCGRELAEDTLLCSCTEEHQWELIVGKWRELEPLEVPMLPALPKRFP